MTTYDETRLSDSDRALIHALLFNAGVLVEPEPESKVWHPKDGEIVWRLDATGFYSTFIFQCMNYWHEESWNVGNIFPTREAAEFEANRRRIIAELKRHAAEFNTAPIDWHDINQEKWSIAYEPDLESDICIYATDSYAVCYGEPVYFTSVSIAKAAIEKIGKDNLIKYYFCINN